MRRMKLFPKTFLYTFAMLLFITASMHLMIYFFYPKVYVSRMQKNLEKNMDFLQQELSTKSDEDHTEELENFARSNGLNLKVTEDGRESTYMGMNFQISLDDETDMVFSLDNIDSAESVVIRNRTFETEDGRTFALNIVASAKPVQEAVDMITFLFPYTFAASLLFSVLFSYLYSKKITDPVLQMLKTANDMKLRKEDALIEVQTEDELGELAVQINEVYRSLLDAIEKLDTEKEHMLQLEKTKMVFLRSASHELKTPLAGLRILLENMQYQVGKYKDRDHYLAEAVGMVDELTAMVRDILDASKIGDVTEESRCSFDPGQELEKIVKAYEIQIAEKKLDVQWMFTGENCICGNKEFFRKVWSNLISNAVRYTGNGGRITIGSDEGRIWIENTCEPLKEEEIACAFEPFYRQNRVRSSGEGNGLGLYMVHELLQKEGLSCRFEAVGDGMRFTVFFRKEPSQEKISMDS